MRSGRREISNYIAHLTGGKHHAYLFWSMNEPFGCIQTKSTKRCRVLEQQESRLINTTGPHNGGTSFTADGSTVFIENEWAELGSLPQRQICSECSLTIRRDVTMSCVCFVSLSLRAGRLPHRGPLRRRPGAGLLRREQRGGAHRLVRKSHDPTQTHMCVRSVSVNQLFALKRCRFTSRTVKTQSAPEIFSPNHGDETKSNVLFCFCTYLQIWIQLFCTNPVLKPELKVYTMHWQCFIKYNVIFFFLKKLL